MPRTPRDIEPGDLSHTTFRTHNREFIFISPEHHLCLLRSLVRIKERYNVRFYSLVAMSNHYHFIHEAPIYWHEETEFARTQIALRNPVRIGDLLREGLSYYVNAFNRTFGREGSIVKDRTKTVKQWDEAQEITTACYEYANPVRAHIVNHPREYLFHTYHLFAFGKLPGPFREFQNLFSFPDWYMKLGKNMKVRQQRFRRLVDAYLKDHGLLKQAGASGSNGPGRDTRKNAHKEFLAFSRGWFYWARKNLFAPS